MPHQRFFMLCALLASCCILLIEVGTVFPGVLENGTFSIASTQPPASVMQAAMTLQKAQPGDLAQLANQQHASGRSIFTLVLLDGLIFVTLCLRNLQSCIPGPQQGQVQKVVRLICALLLIVGAVSLILATLGTLLLMISLLLAVPFGTLVYLFQYAGFNRVGADVVLSILMVCKIGLIVSIFLSDPTLLQRRTDLVYPILLSLFSLVLISFLLGSVPGFLVSITDAIAAIIVAAIAGFYGLVVLSKSIRPLFNVFFPWWSKVIKSLLK